MATSRTIAASGEQVTSTERSVISSLTTDATVILPAIADGSNGTVAAGQTITVDARSTGNIELVDNYGHFVRTVNAGSAVQLTAAGNASLNAWRAVEIARTLASLSADESTGSGSAALGANCPAVTTTAPFKWVSVILSDGTVGYTPVWK